MHDIGHESNSFINFWDVRNKRKRVSKMCQNAYFSIENPESFQALLKWAVDPSFSLIWLFFTKSAIFGLQSYQIFWKPKLSKKLGFKECMQATPPLFSRIHYCYYDTSRSLKHNYRPHGKVMFYTCLFTEEEGRETTLDRPSVGRPPVLTSSGGHCSGPIRMHSCF